MYALAILDQKKNKIYFSRDKIGKKPLYYYFENNFIIWSSELKTFKKSPIKNTLQIDENAIKNYFDVGYIPSPLSIFKKVFKLLPGETIEIDLKTKTKQHYFYETQTENFLCKPNDLSNFENILEDSVRIRTISDVPYGVFLSSGVDSTLVASILAKLKDSKVNSFSIGIEDKNLDDVKIIKKIASNLGLNHHELIINESDLINTFQKWQKLTVNHLQIHLKFQLIY